MAGPEIVEVDVDKYRLNNLGRLLSSTSNKEPCLEIQINACWFAGSQVFSSDATIDINWKGYNFTYPLKDLEFSNDCCENPVIRLYINLLNNVMTCDYKKLVPVLIQSKINKTEYRILYTYRICKRFRT